MFLLWVRMCRREEVGELGGPLAVRYVSTELEAMETIIRKDASAFLAGPEEVRAGDYKIAFSNAAFSFHFTCVSSVSMPWMGAGQVRRLRLTLGFRLASKLLSGQPLSDAVVDTKPKPKSVLAAGSEVAAVDATTGAAAADDGTAAADTSKASAGGAAVPGHSRQESSVPTKKTYRYEPLT
jgi:hypothetical protein